MLYKVTEEEELKDKGPPVAFSLSPPYEEGMRNKA